MTAARQCTGSTRSRWTLAGWALIGAVLAAPGAWAGDPAPPPTLQPGQVQRLDPGADGSLSFRLDALAGMTLSIKARVARGSESAPVLSLTGPDGEALGAQLVSSRGRTSVLRHLLVPVSGELLLVVSAQPGSGVLLLKSRVHLPDRRLVELTGEQTAVPLLSTGPGGSGVLIRSATPGAALPSVLGLRDATGAVQSLDGLVKSTHHGKWLRVGPLQLPPAGGAELLLGSPPLPDPPDLPGAVLVVRQNVRFLRAFGVR